MTLSERIAARTWHYCDGRGATTSRRAATRDELVAAASVAYAGPVPTWMGTPCDRPLIARGSRHAESVRFPARDLTGAVLA